MTVKEHLSRIPDDKKDRLMKDISLNLLNEEALSFAYACMVIGCSFESDSPMCSFWADVACWGYGILNDFPQSPDIQ